LGYFHAQETRTFVDQVLLLGKSPSDLFLHAVGNGESADGKMHGVPWLQSEGGPLLASQGHALGS